MASLVWDQVGEHVFETGISKAVLYTDEAVVPWNGLTSIEEDSGEEVQPVYFDGIKINDIVTVGDYAGTMKAFTYPDEFLPCEGIVEDTTVGFYVLNQQPKRFSLSYQTVVGNDVDPRAGYKIHLVYNLTAIPSASEFETISEETNPTEFEWSISALPLEMDGHRPTAHVIFDSRRMNPNMLADLEDILYGSDTEIPRLPTLRRISIFMADWNRLIITDHGDGTWTADDPRGNYVTLFEDDDSFEITTDSAEFVDTDEYIISSTERSGAI
jgi:hypothetical protein